MKELNLAHVNMVRNQIMPSNVTDSRLLSAFYNTPKHLFLPADQHGIAYTDSRLAVADSRTLLQPETLGKMLQACQFTGEEKVLEIGCSTGYTTVLLAQLCKEVFAIDNVHDFVVHASENLLQFKLTNVMILARELLAGYPGAAPYDIIFVNGKFSAALLAGLQQQLAENGRMILIEDCQGVSKAVVYLNKNNAISRAELFTAYADNLC
jgi:protein-L-isoaspartate(D-aspartate) O-methyltransferase